MSVLKLPRYFGIINLNIYRWQGVGGFLLPTPPPEVGGISLLLIGIYMGVKFLPLVRSRCKNPPHPIAL